jgi:hypothetical protein
VKWPAKCLCSPWWREPAARAAHPHTHSVLHGL